MCLWNGGDEYLGKKEVVNLSWTIVFTSQESSDNAERSVWSGANIHAELLHGCFRF